MGNDAVSKRTKTHRDRGQVVLEPQLLEVVEVVASPGK